MANNKLKPADSYYTDIGPIACWRPTHKPSNSGYVTIKRNGVCIQLHRFVYEQYFGLIPEGMDLHHKCETRWCCNPYHLTPVTNAENTRLGQSAKLSVTQALDIRVRAQAGNNCVAIAKEYGISSTHVYYIRDNRKWATI